MIKPKPVPTIETAAGIPIDLPMEISAGGSITRNGLNMTQQVKRPATADLMVGAKLLNRLDQSFYTITAVTPSGYLIVRAKDGTLHDATLRQLKSNTYVVIESIEGAG